jgi:RNA polymerase sigma factor (sigma-70 family)
MQNRTDAELLREYAANHSEAAFGEIVRRYADVVYSAALRQVGNEDQARDVAQTVFVDLARKVATMPSHVVLIGWLHRGVRLAALELLRGEQRRFHRERQAMELNELSETTDNWSTIRPVLDEAIATLGNEDRDALLLRFFKNESLSSVGTTLGVSEDAAQKRVSRALEKLRRFLAERGIKTTTAALSVTLATNTIQSAPTGFAVSLATGALMKAAVAGTSTASFVKLFTLSNMKTTILSLALVGSLAGIALVQVRSQHTLREAQALAQKRAGEIDNMQVAHQESLNNLGLELARVRDEAREVLRLRNEVTRLRQERTAINAWASQLVESGANTNNAHDDPMTPQIQFQAVFVVVPGGNFSETSLGTITELQLREFKESAAGIQGVKIIEGRVTTLSERQAQIFLPLTETSGETNSPSINLSLDVLATCKANSSVVQMEMVLGTLNYFTGQPSPYGPAYGGDQLNLFNSTHSFKVLDGETLFQTLKLPGDWIKSKNLHWPDQSSVSMLLTTTLIDPAGNRISSGKSSEPYTPHTDAPLGHVIMLAPEGEPIIFTPPQILPSASGTPASAGSTSR